MNALSVNGSNSVVNAIGQVTLVKENGNWKIENDWFNANFSNANSSIFER